MIYGQWDNSIHSQALVDPFYRDFVLLASVETDGFTDVFCSVCHTPIGTLSQEIPPIDGSNLSPLAKKGISCDFCHSITGTTDMEFAEYGNSNFLSEPQGKGGTKRGPRDDAVSPYHKTEFNQLFTKSEFCATCHDVFHPVNGIQLESPYKEWKEGPYYQEGIQCQDCHMKQIPGVASTGSTERPNNPGQSAMGGKNREHVWTHYFVGGNAFLTSGEQKQMAQERLKAAATVEVDAPENAEPGQTVEIKVEVANTGAGHKLPTGLVEIREMWLDVTAADNTGKEFFRSGFLQENGAIEENAVVYKKVVADAEGNPTYKFWLTESIVSDYRIPPKGSVTEKYEIQIPDEIQGPIQVTAKLNYRSAPQPLIDEVMGDKGGKVPVVEMAIDSGKISLPGDKDEEETTPETDASGVCGPTLIALIGGGVLGLYGIMRRRL